MNDSAFSIYLTCIAALALNLWFLTIVTVVQRARAKKFVNPEDAKTFKGKEVAGDEGPVSRAAAAHRNALENILPFSILGLLYVMKGATPQAALIYFITFTAARWLHSLFYLGKIQPFRTLIFVVGFLCNVGLSVQVLLASLR